MSGRGAFRAGLVDVPADVLTDRAVFDVVVRLSAGKKVFTTFASREKRQRPVIAAITIAGLAPAGRDDWQHVRDYLAWRRDVHALGARWKSLAVELGAPSLTAEYPQTIHGFERIVRSINVAIVTAAVAVRNVTSVAGSKLLMSPGDIHAPLADSCGRPKPGAAGRATVTEPQAARLQIAGPQ